MTTDPDILAIRRKRRREGRCLNCGVKAPRAVLCAVCRATLAYCAMCEALYTRRPGLDKRRGSEYCTDCGAASARGRRSRRTKTEYIAAAQAWRHAQLPEIVRRYRKKEPVIQIAQALGITPTVCHRLIRDARLHGEWPAGLWRCRHKEKAHGQS